MIVNLPKPLPYEPSSRLRQIESWDSWGSPGRRKVKYAHDIQLLLRHDGVLPSMPSKTFETHRVLPQEFLLLAQQIQQASVPDLRELWKEVNIQCAVQIGMTPETAASRIPSMPRSEWLPYPGDMAMVPFLPDWKFTTETDCRMPYLVVFGQFIQKSRYSYNGKPTSHPEIMTDNPYSYNQEICEEPDYAFKIPAAGDPSVAFARMFLIIKLYETMVC